MKSVRVKAGETAFVFDGQVGYALAGVNVEGSFQGSCGTSIQAFGTASATVGHRFSRFFQYQRQKQVPDEEK
jgi:hypothetical protein